MRPAKAVIIIALAVMLSATSCVTPEPLPLATPTVSATSTQNQQYSAYHWECWNGENNTDCPSDTSLSLKQMAFVSDTEVWSVGKNGYIAHREGAIWVETEGLTDKNLNTITFLSPQDGWIAGEGGLLLRWNGKAWSIIEDYQAPLPGSGNALIWNAIAFSNPDDGWVVGYETSEGGGIAYGRHWNGTLWETPIRLPPSQDYYTAPPFLWDVVALEAQNIWAVGEGVSGGLTLHWDGSSWHNVPNPFSSLDLGRCWLYDISALAENNIWVAGIQLGTNDNGLVLQWNGREWSDTKLPETGWINSILMLSENNGWAGGDELFHWNGHNWEKAGNPTIPGDKIVDLEKTPNGEVWALTQHAALLHLKILKPVQP